MSGIAIALMVATGAIAEELISAQELLVMAGGKEHVYVYLLAGQSNMSGRGESVDWSFNNDPRVVAFAPLNGPSKNKPALFVAPHEPLHRATDAHAMVGPGLAFASQMATAYPKAMIVVIPVAVSGTCLTSWLPDSGRDYRRAAEWFREAMEFGTPKGIVWVQGECDSAFFPTAERYQKRILSISAAFRKIAGGDIPMVVAETPRFPERTWPQLPGRHMVRRALLELPKHQTNTLVASSGSLDMRDGVHYSSDGQYALARRLFVAMALLQDLQK